jgi:hypothetical protein
VTRKKIRVGLSLSIFFILKKKNKKGFPLHPSRTQETQINPDNFHDIKKKRIFTSQYTKKHI